MFILKLSWCLSRPTYNLQEGHGYRADFYGSQEISQIVCIFFFLIRGIQFSSIFTKQFLKVKSQEQQNWVIRNLWTDRLDQCYQQKEILKVVMNTLWFYFIFNYLQFDLFEFKWLIWKDPDAGKNWRREENGMTEDEMVWWHHRLNGYEFK